MIGPGRLLIGLVIAVALGSCDGSRGGGAAIDRPIRLRVVTAPWLAFAPLHVAEAEGYFAEQGLEVEFVPVTGTELAVPLLLSGSVDVLPGVMTPSLINAIARGAPVRMVGKVQDPTSAGCSSIAIVTRPGLLAESHGRPTQAMVRKVSLNRQAAMLYLADAAFRHAGLEMSRMEIVDLPNAAEPHALASGAVDAALAGEPFLTRTVRTGTGEAWLSVVDALPEVEISLLFFGRRLIEGDPDTGTRFMVAYLQALRQLAAGKTDRNLELIAQATGDDPALLRHSCLPFGPTDGRVRIGSVLKFQAWAATRGLIERPIDASELWDPRFVEGANRALGILANP